MEKLSFPKSPKLVDYYPLGITYRRAHFQTNSISNHGFDMINSIEG